MVHSVLLIDDSAILRRIATNVLGGPSLRFDVVTASRATEGFACACATPPGLILVDAHLAGAGKAELCRRLLAEGRTAAVPVVLLLGRGMSVPPAAELPENIVEILSKPFTPEQLLACVKAIYATSKEGGGFASIRNRLCGSGKETSILVDRQTVAAAALEGANKPDNTGDAANMAEPHPPKRGSHTRPGGSVAPAARRETAGTESLKPAARRETAGTESLKSAFQQVASERGTGALSVTAAGQPLLDVYFDAGSVVVVTTEDVAAYTIGAPEVLPQKVSPATLEAAAAEQRGSGVPFLLTLGARGLLSKAAAVALLHEFGQRFFARVWQMRPASIRCTFTRTDALPGFTLRLEPRRESVENWLLGTLRYVNSEDIALKAKHEGFVGTPLFLRQGHQVLGSFALTDQEREFSKRVNGKTDLPGISKALGCTLENAYLLLHRFRALEIMDYRPAPQAFMVTPRTSVRRVLPLRH